MCQLLALQLPPSSLAQSQQPAFASRSSNLTGDGTDPYVVHVWDRKIPGLPNTKRTATIARSMANGRIFFEATFRCEHTPEHNGSWSRNGCRSRQRPSIVSEKFGVILPPQKKKDGKKKNGFQKCVVFLSEQTRGQLPQNSLHRYREAHPPGLFCLKVLGAEDPQLYMTWSVKASKDATIEHVTCLLAWHSHHSRVDRWILINIKYNLPGMIIVSGFSREQIYRSLHYIFILTVHWFFTSASCQFGTSSWQDRTSLQRL